MSFSLGRLIVPRGFSRLLRAAPSGLAKQNHIRLMSGDLYSPKPWNYLWKPGPYPLTQEARDAAAKKYGMIPEDYKPFPEDHDMGDYPDLAPSSGDSRSGFYDWDIPEMKRNWCEPMRFNYDITTELKYDDTTRLPFQQHEMMMYFLLFYFGFWFMAYLGSYFPYYLPYAERQLPYGPGGSDTKQKKFYTFEIEN